MAQYTILDHEQMLDALVKDIRKATDGTNEIKARVKDALAEAQDLRLYLAKVNGNLPGHSKEEKRAYLNDAVAITHRLCDILVNILY